MFIETVLSPVLTVLMVALMGMLVAAILVALLQIARSELPPTARAV